MVKNIIKFILTFSNLVDQKLGVNPDMGLPIVGLTIAVAMQWIVFFLFCFS